MPRVAILGAGIAGLACGWLLRKRGIDPIVLERQPSVGGLARSFEWHGFPCDFAAHRLFTGDEVALQQLLQLVPMGRHARRSRLFLRNRWLRDPLDILELGLHVPLPDSLRLLLSYGFRPRHLPDESFESFCLSRYGRGLYELFFRPYTEKLFGIPGSEISVLWAQQKVRLANPLDSLRENTKTKFSYFYYPRRGGYGAIAESIYREISDLVKLQATVLGLERDSERITRIRYTHSGVEVDLSVDEVISTLPLTVTGRMLDVGLSLRYRKVEAVYLWINRPKVTDYHWLYFVDRETSLNRLVEFKNMSAEGAPPDTSVLCAEVTRDLEDPVERVTEDLTRAGLIRRDEVLDTHIVREEFAYPVYDKGYEEVLLAAERALGRFRNLHLVGRAAEFIHREVDDNLAAASYTVDQIIQEGREMPISKEYSQIEESIPEGPRRVYAVILAHDNYADTRECLQTLLANLYPALAVILVDNGSSDGTAHMAGDEFPGIETIQTGSNLNVPAGYNIGFRRALDRGADYILMLNNDTTIAPDMVERLVATGEQDPKAGILMPRVLVYGSQDRIWSIGGRYRVFPPSILLTEKDETLAEIPRLIEYAPGCGLLIHRRAFDTVGLFDPGYLFWYDDWDFSERVRAHGLHLQYVPDARMWHKVSRTTKGPQSPLFWRTYGASAVRFYRRHGRPKWISLPVHLGYLILRDFFWKGNWIHWSSFRQGLREGFATPLGSLPEPLKHDPGRTK
jgi:protoporphyrinogen oxidase/GT2 family glycosyltransferase